MYDRKSYVWLSVDWMTIGLYVLMIAAGWLSICGASYEFDTAGLFDPSGRPGSQLIWIASSFALVFVILMLDKDFFETFSYPIYGLILVVLFITIFVAPDIKGSHSWLVMGPIRVQPAEFAKFATALALAKFMNSYNFNLLTIRKIIMVCLLVLIPMGCILMQKETGSALVYLAFALMLYREGMSGFILLASVCAVVFLVIVLKLGNDMIANNTPAGELIVSLLVLLIMLFMTYLIRRDKIAMRVILYLVVLALLAGFIASLFIPINFVWIVVGLIGVIALFLVFMAVKNLIWHYVLISLFAVLSLSFMYSIDYVFEDVLEPHQQMRIKVALGLEDDPAGAGYNVNQSKIAIGSGGFLGKGFLNGTQTKLKYVPEQDTDFIFCTIGEEFGFWGSLLVLGLFGALIIRLIILAERQSTTFGRVYGYSVASIFFFHVLINIGMVMGLTPVIGIPLPFFSYGGSSLWGFTILLFIFLRIDAGSKEVR
ncbi:MAG: rod shape-determining protein RodA [Tannerella sp.]|jgi:rod shape determining protein RodA|nr:rod shape-determining protein RodA [Tannerella sp.]